MIQDVIALSISGLAAAYLFVRLTGWPRKKKQNPVILGARLARGLKKTR